MVLYRISILIEFTYPFRSGPFTFRLRNRSGTSSPSFGRYLLHRVFGCLIKVDFVARIPTWSFNYIRGAR